MRKKAYLHDTKARGKDLYKSLIRQINSGFVLFESGLDDSGRVEKFIFLEVNPQFEELTGRSAGELVGKTFLQVFPYLDNDWMLRLGQAADSGRPVLFDKYFKELGRHFQVTAFSPQPGVVAVIFSDITRNKETEEALRQANEELTRYVATLERNNREVTLLDRMGEMLQSCQSIEDAYSVVSEFSVMLLPDVDGELFLLTETQILLEPVYTWGKNQTTRAAFPPELCWGMQRGQPHLITDPTSRLLCRHLGDGDPTGAHLCIPMVAHGETLGLMHLSGDPKIEPSEWQRLGVLVGERTALAVSNLNLRDRLLRQSIRDPLTQLFNRRYMEQTLERELYRVIRHKRPLAITMFDMDNLKSFNDSYGHDAGDAMLKEFGLFLQTHVRSEDVPCRLGGDEFALILPEARLVDAARRVDYFIREFRARKVLHAGHILAGMTVSAGVAGFPDHGENPEGLLKAADAALYQAKELGGNQVVSAPNHRGEGPEDRSPA